MRFISCHDGKLQTLETAGLKTSPARAFVTGLAALDALAPQQRFARGAVHELLFDADAGQPTFVAALLAQAAAAQTAATGGEREVEEARRHGGTEARRERPEDEDGGWKQVALRHPESSIFHPRFSSRPPCLRASVPSCLLPIIWSDPRGEVYPPGLASLGMDLSTLYLLRTTSAAEEAWAVAECLRCRGVGAVIAAMVTPSRRMSRIQARRLQLAAERGGSVGILLRQTGPGDHVYAAATRWKIAPAPGERTVQRWTIQLLHGHGGRVGATVILEWRRERENHSVRALEKLSRRPAAEKAARATA